MNPIALVVTLAIAVLEPAPASAASPAASPSATPTPRMLEGITIGEDPSVVMRQFHVTPDTHSVGALEAQEHRVDAILLMCSSPEAISATLPRLRAAFGGPIGAYANIGYHRAKRPANFPDSQFHDIEIGENTPERYADDGRRWLEIGAQIVGGCCGTTPEHIAALRPIVHAPMR